MKRRKRQGEKKIPKIEKPRDVGHLLVQKLSQNFDFYPCTSHSALKRNAGVKKGKLLCCRCIFDRIKGNLAKIQPKNHQNVQKMHFSQKVPGVNGLKIRSNAEIVCHVQTVRTRVASDIQSSSRQNSGSGRLVFKPLFVVPCAFCACAKKLAHSDILYSISKLVRVL